jgi:beta-galactosidase
MKAKLSSLLLTGLLLASISLVSCGQTQTQEGRASVTLSNDWKFIKQDAAPDADFSGWETVSVPHTWNAQDGQNGKAANPDQPAGYYRGPAWYARDLDIPATWSGKRVFIRFNAVSLVSDVYINGQHLGQHRGAFGAFCYELTPYLKKDGPNVLRVKADNTKYEDVAPLSGDFTVFGGIYRDVELLAADPVCITPLDHGTWGVFLTQKKVTPEEAVIEVATHLSNGTAREASATVRVDVLDATGAVVQTASTNAMLGAGATAPAITPVTLANPHLWNGRKDPYLYSVRVTLEQDGKPVDSVTQPLGVRTVAISQDKGFLLNGQPYSLHGVNRHQEVKDKGWAISKEDEQTDFGFIMDIGATSLRLAHYQQSNSFLSLCDAGGLVLWEEIPIVERISDDPNFGPNAKEQLTDMILQGYNHPSIAVWGIFNELLATWIKVDKPVDPVPVLTMLNATAHELDPSRPTVAASWSTKPMAIHNIVDWQCFNIYPGWYWGTIDLFGKTVKESSDAIGGKRTAISEYGSGANTTHHQEGEMTTGPKPDGAWHPEEWQAITHEVQWAQAKNNPRLWGTFVWAMFDFASDHRNEGSNPGVNDKGLVTQDRQIKKDSFFFYQSNWAEKPMVHITSARMTPRRQDVTAIKIYSNCYEVELKVNGKVLGTVKPNDIHIALWKKVHLQRGTNQIEATGKNVDGTTVTDSCTWEVDPKAPANPAAPIDPKAPHDASLPPPAA